jgi:2-polyprenyl-3-methyl-5-hydroxy-6-metoxy-1,4-benzoquinol methylase
MESTVCNLCGANRTRLVYRKFDLDISRCRQCGLVYAGPQRLTREETWARYNPNYFRDEYLPALGVVGDRFDLAAFDGRYARMLQVIRPYRQLGTLLEVGCGAGFFLKAAERDGWRVSGLEVMQAGVEFARRQLGLEVRSAAVEDADLPADSYDIIAMFDVIEHLSDPHCTLERIRTLLRPGGWLIITTPNFEALSRRWLGKPWAVLSPAEHLYYFSQDTLGAMLRKAGYGVVWFDRHYAGGGLYETMYPRHNQAPGSWRARTYTRLVDRFGRRVLRQVQARGLADSLWCLAQCPE